MPTSHSESGCFKAALSYLNLGWPVIPVLEDKDGHWKRPAVAWTEFQERLPSEEQVHNWWKTWPFARVGIITGQISNLVVVDIDPKKGGSIDGLDLPATLCSNTGGDGWHYFYRHPKNQKISNATGWPRRGVDVRGDGGFIVAPPSLHQSGKQYEWCLGFDPETIAPCPAWLLQINKTKRPLRLLLDGVHEGQRNDSAARVIGMILAKLPKSNWATEGWEKTVDWNRNNTPPLEAKELNNIFESIAKREERQRVKGDDVEPETQAARLVKLVEQQNIEFFHTDLDQPCARFKVDDHYEIRRIDSKHFKRWLDKLFWTDQRKGLGSETRKSALGIFEGLAFEGKKYRLFNRIAWYDDAIWYDLSDEKWRAVKITDHEWVIIDQPPILFQRYSHQATQVIPQKDGNAQNFLRFFNIPDKELQLLFFTVIISYLIPELPHPVIAVYGPHGSAKTTTLRLIRKLIDPSQIDTIGITNDTRELVQTLDHNYFVPLDNLSSISENVSDILCRAVSGAGGFKRELYTTDDDFIYRMRRCIGLNGINNIVSRPDLIERSVFVELGTISEEQRNTEEEFWSDFDKQLPSILGGCFDIVSKAMVLRPNIKLKRKPRMADFARWGCAITEALGIKKERFIEAYEQNRGSQNEDALSEEPVAQALIHLMSKDSRWQGTSTQLMYELNIIAKEKNIENGLNWPRKPNKLSQKVNELTPSLALLGVVVNKSGKRTFTIHRIERQRQAYIGGGSDDEYGKFPYLTTGSEPEGLTNQSTEAANGHGGHLVNPGNQSSQPSLSTFENTSKSFSDSDQLMSVGKGVFESLPPIPGGEPSVTETDQ